MECLLVESIGGNRLAVNASDFARVTKDYYRVDRELAELKDTALPWLEGWIEELDKELRDTQNAFVNMVSTLTGTEPEPCKYGDPDCAGDISEAGMKIVDLVISGEMKLYHVDVVNDLVSDQREWMSSADKWKVCLEGIDRKVIALIEERDALKMTAEEGLEICREQAQDIAMLLGVELGPCACDRRCVGHLPMEARSFLSKIREQPERGEVVKVRLIAWWNREFRKAGFEVSAIPPAALARQMYFDGNVVRSYDLSGPAVPTCTCPTCGWLVALGTENTHQAMHDATIPPAPPLPGCPGSGKGLGWAQVQNGSCSCPVCGACNLKAVPTTSYGAWYKVPPHSPATAVSDAVQPRSEPEVGVGTTSPPEAPEDVLKAVSESASGRAFREQLFAPDGSGEAATAPWKGIAERAFDAWGGRLPTGTAIKVYTSMEYVRDAVEGAAKEAYEAGLFEGQRKAVQYGDRAWTRGYQSGRKAAKESAEPAELGERYAQGVKDGRAAAEDSKLVTGIRETLRIDGWRPGIRSAIGKLKGGCSAEEFIGLIWEDGKETGIARGREIEQEAQVGESIARERLPRLGEPYIAFTKKLIEKARGASVCEYAREKNVARIEGERCRCSYCEGREDALDKLLDLLEGKSLKTLAGGDSMQ